MAINQINPLRYAAKVAELGSFSAAARACGVSQPTVSGAIVDLEDQLGMRLFVRSTRRVETTPAGAKMLAAMGEVLRAADALEATRSTLVDPPAPEVRLGFTPLVGAGRLGGLTESFQRARPDVAIIYQEASGRDLEEQLDRGLLDVIFGVGFAGHRLRRRVTLFHDALCYLHPRAAEAGPAPAVLADVASDTLLLTEDHCGLASATRRLLADEGLAVAEYAGKAMSYGALEDWVDLGIGGAIIPEPHLRSISKARRLITADGDPIRLSCDAVWRKDLLVSAAAKSFLGELRRRAQTFGAAA